MTGAPCDGSQVAREPERSPGEAPPAVDGDASQRGDTPAALDPDAARDLRTPARWRRRVARGAMLLLAVQLLLPLTYYTVRGAPYDERFAWRMFSAIRLHRCTSEAVEIDVDGSASAPLELRGLVHVGWVSLMRRNRQDVIEAFLRRRCEEAGVAAVRLENFCESSAGEALAPQRYVRHCASGEVELPAESLTADPGELER